MYAFIAAGLKAVRAFSSAKAGPSPAPPRVSLATRWPHRRTHRASRLRPAARPEPKYAPQVRHFPDALTSGSGLRSPRGLVPRLPRPARVTRDQYTAAQRAAADASRRSSRVGREVSYLGGFFPTDAGR